jgi:hypothetical protein
MRLQAYQDHLTERAGVAVPLSTLIREVLGSNLDRDIRCAEFYVVFLKPSGHIPGEYIN